MKLHTTYLEGAVLPTVVVAALVMLTATLGLLALALRQSKTPASNRPPCSTACIPTNGH